MALDFPNSPTTNQVFTAGGMSWTWDGVKWVSGAAGGAYLPLSGGTLTGPLSISSGNLTVTPGSIVATGLHTTGGGIQTDATLSVGTTLTVSGAANLNGGVNAPLGLTVTNIQDNGWLTINAGAQNDPFHITVNNGNWNRVFTTCTGVRTWSCGTRADGTFAISDETVGIARIAIGATGIVSLNAADYYPISITTTGGQATAIIHWPTGQHTWMDGPMSNVAANSFIIYNNSSGGTRMNLNSSQSFLYGDTYLGYSGGRMAAGANGIWQSQNGAEFSPSAAGSNVGGIAVYGAAYAGGWAIYNRTDAWNNYNMLILQGTTACGSITSNGSNAFFNTTCDARRKDNIRSLHSEIDVGNIIDALKPVAFEWKPVEFKTLDQPAVVNCDAKGKDNGTPLIEGELVRIDNGTDHGFIAQDLYEVLPGIVHKPESDDLPMMADYSKIVPYLVAELQTLRKRVAGLEAR